MLAVAAWLSIAAAAPPGGLYEVRQMEIGGALELSKNGRFRYALTYGALDEQASGRWSFDGKVVRLTTEPAPRAAKFELIADEPAPPGTLSMQLDDCADGWGAPLSAVANPNSAAPIEIRAGADGQVDLSGLPAVTAIAPLIPVFGPSGDVFPISPERGHRLRFRFHANDLGTAALTDEPLTVGTDGVLTLKRYDTSIRFFRERP